MRTGILWRGALGELALDGVLVKRRVLDDVSKATSILDAAELLHQQIETDRDTARQVAREEGFEQGRAQGLQQVLCGLAEANAYFDRVADDLTDMVDSALNNLLDTAGRVAITRAAVKESLINVSESRRARLTVSPASLTEVRKLLESLFGDSSPEWLVLEADPNLDVGDVVLHADGSILDARIEVRLEQWRETVRAAIKSRVVGRSEERS